MVTQNTINLINKYDLLLDELDCNYENIDDYVNNLIINIQNEREFQKKFN